MTTPEQDLEEEKGNVIRDKGFIMSKNGSMVLLQHALNAVKKARQQEKRKFLKPMFKCLCHCDNCNNGFCDKCKGQGFNDGQLHRAGFKSLLSNIEKFHKVNQRIITEVSRKRIKEIFEELEGTFLKNKGDSVPNFHTFLIKSYDEIKAKFLQEIEKK